jgi:hypothetical protein
MGKHTITASRPGDPGANKNWLATDNFWPNSTLIGTESGHNDNSQASPNLAENMGHLSGTMATTELSGTRLRTHTEGGQKETNIRGKNKTLF